MADHPSTDSYQDPQFQIDYEWEKAKGPNKKVEQIKIIVNVWLEDNSAFYLEPLTRLVVWSL